jgi:glutaredoxin 3
MATELYTAPNCLHCAAASQDLEWRGWSPSSTTSSVTPLRARLREITGGNRLVPVIVEEGKPVQVG